MKNTNGSGLASENLKKRLTKEQGMLSVLNIVLAAGIGLVLPRATVYGNYAPFGIGLTACVSGPGAIPVFIATLIGYLLKGNAGSLRYMASLIAVIGLRWSVSGFKRVTRSVWFAPVTAFISTLVTGSAMLLTADRTLTDVMLIVSESLLAGGFAYFSCNVFGNTSFALEKEGKDKSVFSYTLVFSVFLMALYSIEWEGISPGRIVAVICILFAAQLGGVTKGAIAGCSLGLTILLADPARAYLIAIYAFGGLLTGVFSAGGKLISILVFALTDIVIMSVTQLEIDAAFFVGLYEIAAASLIFIFLPPSLENVIKKQFSADPVRSTNRSVHDMVAEKLEGAAQALTNVAGTVDTVSKQLASISEPDPGSVYRAVSCTVCSACKSRFYCWEEQFENTMDCFNHLTPLLNQGQEITAEHINGILKDTCSRIPDLCKRINTEYKDYLVRESAFRRLHELRGIVTDQFENSSLMLQEFSQQLSSPEWSDGESAEKIGKQLIRKNYPLKSVHCRILSDGRMEILLVFREAHVPGNVTTLLREIEHLCGRSFALPGVEHADDGIKLLLSEGLVFSTSIGTAQTKCKGERLCGDAFEIFRDVGGKQYVVLSDGMGCGGRAAVDGAMAAGLTSQLLKAGFGYESILRMVNTALLAKSDDETLATLDVACIDLYRGDLELLKAGAGLSLLLSKGRVSRLEDSSLPLGILRELTFARTKDRLVEGDVLLIMSDGISNDGIRWVEDMLRGFDTEKDNVQSLANRIVETAARLHKGEKGDDMTVVAVQIISAA